MGEGDVRLNVEIPPELHERVKEHIDWGLRTPLIRKLMEMICDASDEYGKVILGAILGGHIKLTFDPSSVQRMNTPEETNEKSVSSADAGEEETDG